jgi:hypothetical protein
MLKGLGVEAGENLYQKTPFPNSGLILSNSYNHTTIFFIAAWQVMHLRPYLSYHAFFPKRIDRLHGCFYGIAFEQPLFLQFFKNRLLHHSFLN